MAKRNRNTKQTTSSGLTAEEIDQEFATSEGVTEEIAETEAEGQPKQEAEITTKPLKRRSSKLENLTHAVLIEWKKWREDEARTVIDSKFASKLADWQDAYRYGEMCDEMKTVEEHLESLCSHYDKYLMDCEQMANPRPSQKMWEALEQLDAILNPPPKKEVPPPEGILELHEKGVGSRQIAMIHKIRNERGSWDAAFVDKEIERLKELRAKMYRELVGK